MPRTNEQNQKIKDARKEDILAVALKLFALVGYKKVSVDLITNEVGCSHGLFYHYFDSKEDVFLALFQKDPLFNVELPSFNKAMELGGAEGLIILIDGLCVESSTADEFLYYLTIIYSNEENDVFANQFKKAFGVSLDKLLVTLFTQYIEGKGATNLDATDMATYFKSFIRGLTQNQIITPKRKRHPFNIRFISELFRK